MGTSRLPAAEFDAEEQSDALHPPEFAPNPEGLVQFLSPEGELVEHGSFGDYGPAEGELESLYRDMYLIRRFDQEATALQRQGELALWVPMRGQEAAQIGSASALRPQDYAFPTYREHGVAAARGVAHADLLKLFRGITNGGWNPKDSNFHLYTLVLAAQTPHAVGYAMGMQRDQAAESSLPKAATVAYFGDGASSEGDVHESMVFAASFNAPVVFFCQNNHWAISVPAVVQSRVPLADRAHGYGFPGIRVDGNDVLAVQAVTRWALERARNGGGPVLIEAFTYRMSAHTTADDPTKYRQLAEEEQWVPRDPLTRVERRLRATGTGAQFFEDLEREAVSLAATLRSDVLAMQAPGLEHRFATTYAEAHPLIQEELQAWKDYEAGFAGQEGGN